MQSSPAFIVITLLLGAFLVALFFFGRFSGIRTSTRLYLRRKSNTDVLGRGKPLTMSAEARAARPEENSAKSLNVIFMFNGHSWDAYEILGLPAGAPLAMVEASYAKLKTSVSPDSREFVEMAYRVLRQELTRNPR